MLRAFIKTQLKLSIILFISPFILLAFSCAKFHNTQGQKGFQTKCQVYGYYLWLHCMYVCSNNLGKFLKLCVEPNTYYTYMSLY